MKGLKEICREWLDTLVVAISVAMAFRAYFYEPFNIPTGSMQPTLYGNHCEPCPEPGVMQRLPFKWLEWLFTGRDYKEYVAPASGAVVFLDRGDGRVELGVRTPSGAVTETLTVPSDCVGRLDLGQDLSGRVVVPVQAGGNPAMRTLCEVSPDGTVQREIRVRKGQRLFAGYDTTGDFIFVNRWKWNFRKPARGDVMVFSTTGINRLAQGTHYIKRLTALPGETVDIVAPDVLINGEKIASVKPAAGAAGETMPEPNPGRAGGMTGPVALGENEYFACGDNSDNSFDSRYWGPVPESNLRGTGACVFWPVVNPRWGVIR